MDKKAFYKLSYGLYIVSSMKEDKINGQIANTAFQVTSEPPTVAVSINKQNLTHEYIQASTKFTVSIISQSTPMPFIGNFSFKCGRDINKFFKTRAWIAGGWSSQGTDTRDTDHGDVFF